MKKRILIVSVVLAVLVLNALVFLNASYAATTGPKTVVTKTLPVTGVQKKQKIIRIDVVL